MCPAFRLERLLACLLFVLLVVACGPPEIKGLEDETPANGTGGTDASVLDAGPEPSCSDGLKNGDETGADCGGTHCSPCKIGQTCDIGTDCESAVCTNRACAEPRCDDRILNGDETDEDCGGSCPIACAEGNSCKVPADCAANVCTEGKCQPASCGDGAENAGETDIDCGGPCAPCTVGGSCSVGIDCTSGVCSEASGAGGATGTSSGLTCQEPACGDGIKNGDEADADCGGPCADKCETGAGCALHEDCVSGVCNSNRCVAPACDDDVRNGQESDVDCGGGECPNACDDGRDCGIHEDCQSLSCINGVCEPPSCTDASINGEESDLNCGGTECAKCEAGKLCNGAPDCQSLSCSPENVCLPASCQDSIQNQGETDTDCGGTSPCRRCSHTLGESCLQGTDCQSGVCHALDKICSAPTCSDRVKNNTDDHSETDTDCGGSCTTKCDTDQRCLTSDDCQQGVCLDMICQAAGCNDQVQNGDPLETDVDCGGGACKRCADELGCVDGPRDCVSRVCIGNICQPASCEDRVKNDTETDIDCGGGGCPECLTDQTCAINSDCESRRCDQATLRCLGATCGDETHNQDETDVDCGGTECDACPSGKRCRVSDDCESRVCGGNFLCQAARCDDGVQNRDESDTDCGGLYCNGCDANLQCASGADCKSGVCDPGTSLCKLATCSDKLQNQQETDVDCGGSTTCNRCGTDQTCQFSTDCLSRLCTSEKCIAPSCEDRVKNGTETDEDCGGTCTKKCDGGKGCLTNTDCVSLVCSSGVCLTASCENSILDGAESDTDCGGNVCPKCADGRLCKAGSDCSSGVCHATNKTCSPPSCGDGVQNQTETHSETDIDCGGSCTNKCAVGQACSTGTDCVSHVCTGGICTETCSDEVPNGTETDVDCGGSSCGTCSSGKKCLLADDCRSMVCTENVCIAASCEDAVQNQTETDIDCGGAACGASCEVGDKCTVHGDCQTGNCLSGSCRASSDLWCESRIPNVDKIVDNALRPQLKIVNTGTSDMPLSELTVRYWYTVDGIQSQNYTCSSATSSVGCSNILVGFSAFTPAVAGADAYVDFTFTSAAGVLSAGGSVAFQGIVRKTDFSDYDEADDFSYNPASDHVITTAVSLYRNGALVWGLEPKAIRAPEAAAGSIAGLDYRYFEGSFSLLPDFTQLTPVKTGAINNFLLSVANRSDNFALEYTGFLDVASDGVYRFSTTSDDGSRLMIGSSLVVWNDGLHVARETRGTIALKRGKHTINVAFFESSGTESLVVRWGEGAAVTLQAIPDGMLFR